KVQRRAKRFEPLHCIAVALHAWPVDMEQTSIISAKAPRAKSVTGLTPNRGVRVMSRANRARGGWSLRFTRPPVSLPRAPAFSSHLPARAGGGRRSIVGHLGHVEIAGFALCDPLPKGGVTLGARRAPRPAGA